MTFRLRPEAQSDLDAIVLTIAADNPTAAMRWLEDMEKRFRRLSEMPRIGVARPEIAAEMRTLNAGTYFVLYRETGERSVEIVRVLHGARQWQDLL